MKKEEFMELAEWRRHCSLLYDVIKQASIVVNHL
jgi:hypothetical protein